MLKDSGLGFRFRGGSGLGAAKRMGLGRKVQCQGGQELGFGWEGCRARPTPGTLVRAFYVRLLGTLRDNELGSTIQALGGFPELEVTF